MATLTSKQRNRLPDSAFVFPGKRAYPINDISHARNALARVSAYGSPSEQTAVKRAVYARYPELRKRKTAREHRRSAK